MKVNINNTILPIAKERGCNNAEYSGEWNGYSVYHIWNDTSKGSCCGIPFYVIVDNKGQARVATFSENHDILFSL